MQIADYISTVTGKPISELFDFVKPLVSLEQAESEPISIVYWDESLTATQPTPEEISTALAAPDPVVIPASVSSRQFKLKLYYAGLLDQVDAWVASQDKEVQISYEYSLAFVRTEPMMATGFKALGFTETQINDFFLAASKL